jgi:antitoxin HicB
MIYYAKIIEQSDAWFVEFPELEGCFTEGETLNEALDNAKEALDGWLASNCDRELSIPEAKNRRGRNYHPIEVDVRVAFPIMLRKARKKRRLSQQQVAERLGVSQQAYAKLETPLKSNPALATIQKLSEALNLEFELVFAA